MKNKIIISKDKLDNLLKNRPSLVNNFKITNTSHNTETIFQKGPVIKAMEAGAIVLIDEIDRGSNKLMCLQGILEGKPVLLKKTGEVVKPAPGFNIIGTANTSGRGDEEGRFIAANILDDAFLERFYVTIENDFPTATVEAKILMKKTDVNNEDFVNKLVAWANTIRKTYKEGGISEVVSTRRLLHILSTFKILGNKAKAIKLATSRYDEETSLVFFDLYTKIDDTVSFEETPENEEVEVA